MHKKFLTRKSGQLTCVLALALTLILLLTLSFKMAPVDTASAARSASAWTMIAEIYDDTTQSFDGDNIMALIKALTEEGTYSALATAAQTNATSKDFREANDGNNISVWFGGMKWDAVYLTTAQNSGINTENGDIILDLWRSSDTLTPDDAATYSGYWSDKGTDKEYPSNMYSTSKIRVETLNAGGKYTKIIGSGPDVGLTEHSQDSGNKYARFTMSKDQGVENSLTEYIAKPSEVGYQGNEYDEGTMTAFYGPKESGGFPTQVKYYYFPNDAYDELRGGEWYKDGLDMSVYTSKGTDETAYDAWKDDYLWLPSLTETGMSNGNVSGEGDGMWNTDASIRSAKSGVGRNYCWLRSGSAYDAQRAYLLDDSGNRNQLVVSNDGCGVRPALHLNLTAATKNAILDKDSWKNETKTYSPDGVTWKIVNTDMVEINPVGSDTSWWDKDNNTITATKAGKYELTVKPMSGTWKDGTDDEITVTYTVVPDNMKVTFNNGGQGVFNNKRLQQRQDIVYSLGMDPIALKLPDPTDEKFPINWKDVSWYGDTISKLKIQYIVQKYDETDDYKTAIDDYLNELKEEKHSEEWKNYEELTDKFAQELKVYVVYFKAMDTEGNHNTHYDYFVIHITSENLKISLSEAAIKGFGKGVEYGDVAHAKGDFEQDILGGIQKVIGKLNTDKTKEFKDNIKNFTFYLRKDNSTGPDGKIQDDGAVYTVEDDGIHLQNGSQKVNNLPLGTYHLYVAVKDENASKYLAIEWSGDRPSFKVLQRKINVTLTFTAMTYGEEPTNWVTATASRTEGTWYAQNEATADNDLDILGLSYTLKETDSAPSETTPANTYTVVPTWTNENYEVQFTDEHGSGTELKYTIEKAPLTVTAKNKVITFGDEPSNDGVTYSGFVNEEDENDLSGALTFDYGGYAAFEDIGEYAITPSGLSSDNYDITFESGTLTIIKAKYNIRFGDMQLPYDGEEHSIFVKDLPDGVSVTYDGNGQKAVGEYDVTATFSIDDEAHYEIPEPMRATLTIMKAKLTVTANDNSITYLDAPSAAGVAYYGFVSGEDETVLGGKLTYGFDYEQFMPAGIYTITPGGYVASNYYFDFKPGKLIVVKPDYDLSNLIFEDATLPFDGSEHSLQVEGELPFGLTLTYENNAQTEPGAYKVIAIFSDVLGEIERMSATLTILSGLVSRLEYTSPGNKLPDVIVESAKGFDIETELVVELNDEMSRTYLLWKADEFSKSYTIRLVKDGKDLPYDGTVKVSLLLPETLRNKSFTLSDGSDIEYTIDGNYIVFTTDKIANYEAAGTFTPYFPMLIYGASFLVICAAALILLAEKLIKYRKR